MRKLEQSPPAPGWLQQMRALQVLEMIGTPEARALVEELAKGDPDSWLTQQAREAQRRLENRGL